MKDLLVHKGNTAFLDDPASIANIATSSIRRKAQWLRKYPRHQLHNLRGNVIKRLEKLAAENWDAAIFAAAGLERINVRPENSLELDWMIPAPAQGAIVVACRENDEKLREALAPLNHIDTDICTREERAFLRTLLGGCTTPISAYAYISDGELFFEGSLCSLDGSQSFHTTRRVAVSDAAETGKDAALEILANGGEAVIQEIRNAQR